MSMRFIMSMLVIATMTSSSSGAKHKKVMYTFASVDESEWFNPLENKDKVEAFIETWGGQDFWKRWTNVKHFQPQACPNPLDRWLFFWFFRHTAISCFRLVRREPCSSTLLGAAGLLCKRAGHTTWRAKSWHSHYAGLVLLSWPHYADVLWKTILIIFDLWKSRKMNENFKSNSSQWKTFPLGSLRLPHAVCVCGPPCSLFIWISAGTHRRCSSLYDIYGNVGLKCVRMSNAILRNFAAWWGCLCCFDFLFFRSWFQSFKLLIYF